MKVTTENIVTGLLGILMFIFGLNKFLQFIPVAPPADPTAQQFLGTMFSSYLYVVVALAEILGGLLLFFPRLRFLGWLLLLPIIVNIVFFHLAHDFIGNGIWLLPTAIYIWIGYFNRQHLGLLLATPDSAKRI